MRGKGCARKKYDLALLRELLALAIEGRGTATKVSFKNSCEAWSHPYLYEWDIKASIR